MTPPRPQTFHRAPKFPSLPDISQYFSAPRPSPEPLTFHPTCHSRVPRSRVHLRGQTGLGSWAECWGSLTVGSTDPHRALAERLARVGPPESEPAREAATSALDRVTRLCHRVLADLLFQELQVSEAGGRGGTPGTGEGTPTPFSSFQPHESIFGKQMMDGLPSTRPFYSLSESQT